MPINFSGMWDGMVHGHRPPEDRPGMDPQLADLRDQVGYAHREWQAAQQYFQMVSEPELVDHAIFALEAAQQKYLYLYRQLRQSYWRSPEQEG